MRFVLCVIALLVPSAAGASSLTYVSSGSQLHFVAVRAPLPATRLGRHVLGVVDGVLGSKPAPPPLLGRHQRRSAPRGWRNGLAATRSRGKAPFGAHHGKTACTCATSLGNTKRERIAALFASTRFVVGAELAQLRVLRLRARFRDGIVVYINGKRVVRRNLVGNANALGPAVGVRGPEWETFYIPVSAGMLRRGDNMLAVQVRPSKHQLAPSLDLELSATTGPRIVRGPMLQQVDETSAVLVFDTDLPARGVVEYGPTASLGSRALSAGGGLAVHHVVKLVRLRRQKPVHYRIVAGGDLRGPYRFHTAPGKTDPVRFIVYGDVRGGHKVHRRIVQALVKEAPDFVVVTGDLVLRGSDEGDWQRFFAVTADLLARVPYYPIAGNHDKGRTGEEQRRMNEVFALWPGPKDRPAWGHWYSFDVANIHFVMLDSNSYTSPLQLRWLEQDLKRARARGVRAIFTAVHDGPYSRGLHRGNRYAATRYAPLLVRHGVTMLFSGHDHLYQRGTLKGLRYIVSGGGGAPLYSVNCRRGCPRDGMRAVKRAFHYITIAVFRDSVRVCPKRPDGSRLEACLTYKL